jgi:hypothetical protein
MEGAARFIVAGESSNFFNSCCLLGDKRDFICSISGFTRFLQLQSTSFKQLLSLFFGERLNLLDQGALYSFRK